MSGRSVVDSLQRMLHSVLLPFTGKFIPAAADNYRAESCFVTACLNEVFMRECGAFSRSSAGGPPEPSLGNKI